MIFNDCFTKICLKDAKTRMSPTFSHVFLVYPDFFFLVSQESLKGMERSAKRGGWPTLELFTVIRCGPNFAISEFFEAKIIRQLPLSLKNTKTQMSSDNDKANFWPNRNLS